MSYVEIKAYIEYCYIILGSLQTRSASMKNDEVRWQVIKAMLDEFPALREKVKKYLQKSEMKC
jgi:hypothetical protein